MKIYQIVGTLNFGDAIGNDVVAIKHVIEEMGIETEIYANSIAEKVKEILIGLLSGDLLYQWTGQSAGTVGPGAGNGDLYAAGGRRPQSQGNIDHP